MTAWNERLPAASDPKGQKFLREIHEKAMTVLRQYPTLYSRVFTEAWATEFLTRALGSCKPVDEIGSPGFYLAAAEWYLPPLNLDNAEKGLAFICAKATKEDWTALVGQLRSQPTGAEFEVMLAWALTSCFAAEHVEPYPKLAGPKSARLDFAVSDKCGRRVLLEAVTLLPSRRYGKLRRLGTTTFNPTQEAAAATHRLQRVCTEKAKQRKIAEPFILCVEDWTTGLEPADVPHVLDELMALDSQNTPSTLVAVGHFKHEHYTCQLSNARIARLGAGEAFIREILEAVAAVHERTHDLN